MKTFILPTDTPSTCEPLTSTRCLGHCFVAGECLAGLQKKQFLKAGIAEVVCGQAEEKKSGEAVSQGGELAVFVRSDAWLALADINRLIENSSPVTLTDENAEILAWMTDRVETDVPGRQIRCRESATRLLKYPWDLLAVNEDVMETLENGSFGDAEMGGNVYVDGHLTAGEGTRILPGVYVEGNVIIGKNCKIGPNCYLRGKTAIGDDCHIGQAVEIKNSIIMDNVSAGHLSYIGDSIIGAGTNLGAGTITANLRHDNGNHRSLIEGRLVDTGRRKFGTVMGEDVHTGIHTSIYPGRKLWDGVSTRPGSVVSQDIHAND